MRLRGLFFRWIANALALLLVSYIIDGIYLRDPLAAFAAAAVLGVVNAIVRPIVLLLTLPITIVTLGLFTLVINAAMLALTASIVRGFEVTGFWPAVFGAFLLTLISWALTTLVSDEGKIRRLR